MNTTQQLLSENKKALQFLHTVRGFDFQAPHVIIRGEGKFTFNEVKKAVRHALGDGKNEVMLLVKTNEEGYSRNKLYALDATNGKFEHSLQPRCAWHYDINEFFNKGHIEDVRKNNVEHYYIIAQRSNDTIEPANTHNVDYYDRFKLKKQERNPRICGDGKGNRWISELSLNQGFKETEYNPGVKTSDINDIMDKSGYLKTEYQREMKRKAAVLRNERNKQGALLFDSTGKENEIVENIKKAKAKIASMVMSAENFEQMDNVKTCANNLRWAMYYFDSHMERKSENKYKSVDEITDALNFIDNKLDVVLK